jgi:hypothetical protein
MTTDDITDSAKIDDDEIDNSRIITRNSPRKKAPSNNNQSSSSSTRRHSSRKTVRQTKSRIRLMCKLILIYKNKIKIKVSF